MAQAVRYKIVLVFMLFFGQTYADVYVRHNQAGYSPNRVKQVIVMSDTSLSGQTWKIMNSTPNAVVEGVFEHSIAAVSDHTAKAFNYVIDFSQLTELGTYTIHLASGSEQMINITENPYPDMISAMLRFLRVARSGTIDTLLSGASHMGDKAAIVYRPSGDIAQGQWQKDAQAKTIDMLGGWYDAADYIKFTLTTAYTTYYLLRAFEEFPQAFDKKYSQTDLIDILDEAKHGLDYLVKTHPTNDEFIIQVSTGIDHLQGYRLPENDSRDGEREALSAISPAQMGLTSAALALGSKIFQQQNQPALAKTYLAAATTIYQRARAADALTETAFERDSTNDFYLDPEPNDNMGLAAIELFLLTGHDEYLAQTKSYLKKAGNGQWAAWCCVTASLNYRASTYSEEALRLFHEELLGYATYDQDRGNIWGIPMVPSWAPLPGAAISAAYSGLGYLASTQSTEQQDFQQSTALLWNNIDYFFGRNNWGVSFIAMPELSRPATNVYSQIYKLTGEYPLGAVAEGPGSKSTFESLSRFFKSDERDAYFEQFNTDTQIFYDNSSNFQTMESTIVGQATAIYMLAIAQKVAQLEVYDFASDIPTSSDSEDSLSGDESNNVDLNQEKSQAKKESGGVAYWLLILCTFCLIRRLIYINKNIK